MSLNSMVQAKPDHSYFDPSNFKLFEKEIINEKEIKYEKKNLEILLKK